MTISNVFRMAAISTAAMIMPGLAHANPDCADSALTLLAPLLRPLAPTADCVTLVGVWVVTVHPNGGPSFTAYNMFSADGNSLEFDNSGSPAGQTVAVGPWRMTSDKKYSFTEVNQLFDSKGNYAGTLTVKAAITLDDSGNNLTSTFTFTVRDPNEVVLAQGTGSATGKRLSN